MGPGHVQRQYVAAAIRYHSEKGDVQITPCAGRRSRALRHAHETVCPFVLTRLNHQFSLIRALSFVAALLLEITYGHPVESLDDPYFLLMDEATRGTSDGGPAAAIVDFFPFRVFFDLSPGVCKY